MSAWLVCRHAAWIAVAVFASLAPQVQAVEIAVAPVVDQTGLPVLGEQWLPLNPYRGNSRAIEVGKSAFNQACAKCHGSDALQSVNNGAIAPDLRRLNRYCRRIADEALQKTCLTDNDRYFVKTVKQGKVVVGIVHMPAWDKVLSQELVWAIQAFIESQAK